MQSKKVLSYALAAAALGLSARAQETTLESRVAELEKKLAATPEVQAGASGFRIRSQDKSYDLRIQALIQADARFFLDDERETGIDQFTARRVRPTFQGTLAETFSFRITPELAGSSARLLDAWGAYRASPAFRIQAGQFKAPFGQERLQGGGNIRFIERAYPTNLAPNRDIGLQLSGDLLGSLLSYEIGVFNGVADGGSTSGGDSFDDADVVGRIRVRPFQSLDDSALKGLTLGLAFSEGKESGTEATATAAASTGLRNQATVGQQTFFRLRGSSDVSTGVLADGTRSRLGPQFSWYVGSLGLWGEYTTSSQEARVDASRGEVELEAYDIGASWVLTGEKNTDGAIRPAKPFKPSAGQWGAWELAVRYTALEADDSVFPLFANPAQSASKAETVGVALSAWLTNNSRVVVDYNQTSFVGGAAGGADRPDEEALFARFQVSF